MQTAVQDDQRGGWTGRITLWSEPWSTRLSVIHLGWIRVSVLFYYLKKILEAEHSVKQKDYMEFFVLFGVSYSLAFFF